MVRVTENTSEGPCRIHSPYVSQEGKRRRRRRRKNGGDTIGREGGGRKEYYIEYLLRYGSEYLDGVIFLNVS